MTGSGSLAVVVPLKGGPLAKSRLDLPAGVRVRLAEAFARDTLAAVVADLPDALLVVVTGDARTAAWCGDLAEVLGDPGGGLDAAVRSGLGYARSRGHRRAAVLLGDHPALRPGELAEAVGHPGPAVVPDADGTGTALLLVALDAGLPVTAFGPGSAAAHEALGHRRVDLDLPGLRTDVDDAPSLHRALRLGVGDATRAALRRVTLPGVQATIHRAPDEQGHGGSALLDDGTQVAVPRESLADSGLLHLRVGQRVTVELDDDGRTCRRAWIAGIGPGRPVG